MKTLDATEPPTEISVLAYRKPQLIHPRRLPLPEGVWQASLQPDGGSCSLVIYLFADNSTAACHLSMLPHVWVFHKADVDDVQHWTGAVSVNPDTSCRRALH